MNKDLENQLNEVNEAISKVMSGGQSYKIGNRSLTRADINVLYKMKTELELKINATSGDLLDGTKVAYFEKR